MDKKSVIKFAVVNLIIGIVLLAISYFFFHYVTDSGITTVHQSEAGKPFVTELIGDLAVLFIFSSAVSFIYSLIFCKNK